MDFFWGFSIHRNEAKYCLLSLNLKWLRAIETKMTNQDIVTFTIVAPGLKNMRTLGRNSATGWLLTTDCSSQWDRRQTMSDAQIDSYNFIKFIYLKYNNLTNCFWTIVSLFKNNFLTTQREIKELEKKYLMRPFS